MKKKALKSMLLTGLLVAALGVSTVVSAEQKDVNWNVTFTAAGRMDESSFNSEEINNTLSAMQPGDTAVFTVAIRNSNSSTTDWYMENEARRTLEEASAASNGAYTYVLDYENDQTHTVTNLFNSDRVGGVPQADVSNNGLKDATTGLNEWFYLDELRSGEGGHVTLKVALEGESQGNDFQNTQAQLRLRFAVELKENAASGSQKSASKVVKTGDPTHNLPYIIAAAVAGVILLVLAIVGTSKRRKEKEQDASENNTSDREGGHDA